MFKLFTTKGLVDHWKDIIVLYDDLNFSRIIRNTSLLCRRLPQDQDKIGIDFVGSYDGENITFYYLIQSMPKELLIDFKDRIRTECKSGVRVNFLDYIRGHKIDWDSAQMRSRLRVLKQVGSENDSNDVNAYNLHENIGAMGKQLRIEDSLQYLAIADIKRNRSLLKSSMLITIAGKRGENFDDSIKLIETYAKHIGIRLHRVLYDIPDLLRFFSPFSRTNNKSVSSILPTQVLTDEILARYNVYNQGTLGTSGVYFGTDVYSRFPVLKKVKQRDDSAEIWLVTAKTGGGKSHKIKMIILQLLGLNYNGTIMDIEGFEYIPLANFMSHSSKVVVINMAEGSGKYFDPVEIPRETGLEDIDKDAKNMSVNFTLAVFKTILGRAYDEDIWLDTVVNDAVSEMYKGAKVTDDRETWIGSEGLSLFSVFAEFFKLKSNKFREDVGYLSALEKAIAITSKYFEPDGTRASVFNEKVVVSDIIDAKLVVCSFGMAGKAQQAVDEVQLALMQLGAAQLSHQRSIFSKSKGLFNFKIWEEFQRWGKFPDSDKTIGVAVTGGRKLGDVNIIITNNVKELLDDDRFGILGNITSYIVGAISDEKVRKDLCDRMSIPHMKKELDLIAAENTSDDEMEGSTKGSAPLAYAFLCGLDGNKFGIIKTVLPDDLTKSRLFKTGVDLNG
jgi:hypothetical protein